MGIKIIGYNDAIDPHEKHPAVPLRGFSGTQLATLGIVS
jgi:hypothetical protein